MKWTFFEGAEAFNSKLAWDTSAVTTMCTFQREGLQPGARLGHERGDDDAQQFNTAKAFSSRSSGITTMYGTFYSWPSTRSSHGTRAR